MTERQKTNEGIARVYEYYIARSGMDVTMSQVMGIDKIAELIPEEKKRLRFLKQLVKQESVLTKEVEIFHQLINIIQNETNSAKNR